MPRINLDPCATSPLIQESNYPSLVVIQDGWAAPCPGNDGGNLNIWRISDNGVLPLLLRDSDAFTFSATLKFSGHGGEASSAGIQVSPFWSNSLALDGLAWISTRTPSL